MQSDLYHINSDQVYTINVLYVYRYDTSYNVQRLDSFTRRVNFFEYNFIGFYFIKYFENQKIINKHLYYLGRYPAIILNKRNIKYLLNNII